jgi:hypothetical protein
VLAHIRSGLHRIPFKTNHMYNVFIRVSLSSHEAP